VRVLYVNQTADVSGAERSLLTLISGLREEVEPVLACPPGTLTELAHGDGVATEPILGTQASFRLHPVHTTRGVAEIARSAWQVRGLARSQAPDLVHANTTRAALLALLARRSRPPVVAHIRDWAPEGKFSRFVLSVVGNRADLVVANSAYIARQFDGLALRRPVAVIHNPVDLGKFDPEQADRAAVRAELGLGEGEVALAVVAQLTPWKGQDDAIRALAKLHESGRTEATLLLAGSAKFSGAGTQFDNAAYAEGLHELAAELGVAERVRFLGERSDVPNVLAAADVLLLPSWQEAFGRIAIEAMAMGVPVLATDNGGPAEIVRTGVDGVLLAPKQPEAWARALEPLVDDAELRARMGTAGRERAKDFSVEVHAAQVMAAYRELVS
jgi:L-malate glycosyltransferase